MRPSINDTRCEFGIDTPLLDKARKDAHRRGMHLAEHLRDLVRSFCVSDRTESPEAASAEDLEGERGGVAETPKSK